MPCTQHSAQPNPQTHPLAVADTCNTVTTRHVGHWRRRCCLRHPPQQHEAAGHRSMARLPCWPTWTSWCVACVAARMVAVAVAVLLRLVHESFSLVVTCALSKTPLRTVWCLTCARLPSPAATGAAARWGKQWWLAVVTLCLTLVFSCLQCLPR